MLYTLRLSHIFWQKFWTVFSSPKMLGSILSIRFSQFNCYFILTFLLPVTSWCIHNVSLLQPQITTTCGIFSVSFQLHLTALLINFCPQSLGLFSTTVALPRMIGYSSILQNLRTIRDLQACARFEAGLDTYVHGWVMFCCFYYIDFSLHSFGLDLKGSYFGRSTSTSIGFRFGFSILFTNFHTKLPSSAHPGRCCNLRLCLPTMDLKVYIDGCLTPHTLS